MNGAKDIDEFVREVADLLSIGESVRYDLDDLSYGNLNQMQMDEYWEYVEVE